ncbi:MAG: DegV family protein [Lachnospiraceae bacterium]|nr:DegV family protein [Lachnospiraceae bacterium]
MSSIAIITDSNSGITQNEAKELGIYVIPMPFIIDEQNYYEDINLTQEEFYKKMEDKVNVATSQPSPGEIMKVWDEALKEHETALYIPMSSGLSGTCATAIMLAEDYEGKVLVVDNQRISVTQKNSVMDALKLVKEGHDIQSIYDALMETKLDASIYIMVDTLKYLRKGGRLTPAVAALGTILRIKPVLQIQGEKLDTFAKARTVKQGMSIMLKALQDDMENRFHNDLEGMYINIAHTQNEKGANELKEEIWKIYPGIEIMVNPLSLSVSCHIGPGALAVAMAKKANIS